MILDIGDWLILTLWLCGFSACAFWLLRKWVSISFAAPLSVPVGWLLLSVGGGLMGAAVSPNRVDLSENIQFAFFAYAPVAVAVFCVVLLVSLVRGKRV